MPTCLCLRQSVIGVVAHYINICLWFGQFYTWRPVYEGGIVEHDYLCMIWTLLYVTTFLWLGDCFIWLPCTVLYITICLWLGLFCTWLSFYDWDYFVHDYLSMIGTILYITICLWLGLFCTWLPVYDRDYFIHEYLSMIGTVFFMTTSVWWGLFLHDYCLYLEQFCTWLCLWFWLFLTTCLL